MDAAAFDQKYRSRLETLSTTNLSDALDKVGIRGAVIGVRPLFGMPRIVGRAVTIKIVPAGRIKSKSHLGVEAIAGADRGDIIVIDNRGDIQNNCWGGVLSCAAKARHISGVVIDGAARDVDECQELDFPVFARGVVPITARGRIMQEDYNCPIQLGGVRVEPGDVLVADVNGVVVLPPGSLDAVTAEAEALHEREEAMKADIVAGIGILEVDRKYGYERMLEKG